MRTFLKPLEAEDNLAILFNKYMASLDKFEIIFHHSYDSMALFRQGIQNQDIHLSKKIYKIYELIVLQNSLKGFHQAVIESITLIEKYLQEFKGDWIYYASAQRMESIEKYGGEEEDYDEEGNIIFKKDTETLTHYTICNDLAYYIGGNYQEEIKPGEVRGEGLGTSQAIDFEDLTLLVRNESSFSIFKFFDQQGKSLSIYRMDENGEMIPMDTSDKIEAEMNQDIRNASLADLFEWAIDLGGIIRQKFEALSPTENHSEAFQNILHLLYALRDLKPLKEYPFKNNR